MIKVSGFASLYKLPLFVRMRTKARNNRRWNCTTWLLIPSLPP